MIDRAFDLVAALHTRALATSALAFAAILFAVALTARIALDQPARGVAGGVAVVAIVAFCLLRWDDGWDVFGALALPGCVGTLAEDLAGAPRPVVTVALLPVMVWLLRDVDRDARSRRAR